MRKPPFPKPQIPGLPQKAKAVIQNRPQILLPMEAEAARERAAVVLDRIQSSPLANSPAGQAFQQFLLQRLSRGEDLEDVIQELRERAKEEIDKRRAIVQALADALRALRAAEKVPRLRQEVLPAARSGTIRGSEVWDRISGILDTPYPFLSWIEQRIGPFTIGLSLQMKGGLAVGGSYGEGISGLRHCFACHFRQASLSIGATAGADYSLQLSVAPGKPAQGFSVSIEVGGGGGSGAAAGASASFTPIPRQPTLQDSRLFDWAFGGVAASAGSGGGLDVGVSIGLTHSTVLPGVLP